MRLIVGEAYGMSSPVKTYSPMFYIAMATNEGSKIKTHSTQETAIFPITGKIEVNGKQYSIESLLY